MRWAYLLCVLLMLSAMVVPVSAGDENRYSYINVEGVTIDLVDDRAMITMDFSVDESIRLLVYFLGKTDLRNKLLYVINYESGIFREIDLDHAIIEVDGAAIDYRDGTFWFPSHEFNVIIPLLRVKTPQVSRLFEATNQFPDGIGYFQNQ